MNLKLSTKIISGFCVIIILMFVAIGVYQYALTVTSDGFKELVSGNITITASDGDSAQATKHIMQLADKGASLAKVGLGVGLFTIFASMFFAVVLSRTITKPIYDIVNGLLAGAKQVSSAAGQMSSSSQHVADGASEQAAALEETSASMEEMASMTRQNADNAKQADVLMKDVLAVIGVAEQSINAMNKSMDDISTASAETSQIIKTIDEIAFQTNLLALNAAVEAARAGEAGAGFSVVAHEVRNLAMRAAEAAKNTSTLIDGTVQKVNSGKEIVVKTNDSFVEVAQSSNKIGSLVSEIAAASRDQSQGFAQINKAITEMDTVTQQNSATAEQSAAAAGEMKGQSGIMAKLVGDLQCLVDGVRQEDGSLQDQSIKEYDSAVEKVAELSGPISQTNYSEPS